MAARIKIPKAPNLTVAGQKSAYGLGSPAPSWVQPAANSIGAPYANTNSTPSGAAAKVKSAALAAARVPVPPKPPVGGINKIRVRRKRIRYVPPAPAGGFTAGEI
jgi:hypothetical protein